ncbi:hypothetical protein V6U81_01415 [Micromonospora sp. CPCC 205711]|uniref:hypothetical protein n=1 Tax=Micromonospora sp. CPCC 205547 TaxID=3122400 RepID=UPI002FF2E820
MDPWPALPEQLDTGRGPVVVSPATATPTARYGTGNRWPALPDDRPARLPAGAAADPAHLDRLAAEQRGA